jgi:nicotinate-nucleotide--dimethylbenzimidazole phosphoribosyltransferase
MSRWEDMPQGAGADQVLEMAIAAVKTADPAWERRAWDRLDSLTKPPRSLGRLEEAAARVAALQHSVTPSVERKALVIMAADHGVTAQGVSPYPPEVTAQMVANFVAGGAAINQLAQHVGARLVLVDAGMATDMHYGDGVIEAKVARGTRDMTVGPAMSRAQALQAVGLGMETALRVYAEGADLVGIGEMGIGNSTAAAAVTAALTGASPAQVVGRGTGLDGDGVRRKIDVVRRALDVNAVDPSDPLSVLAEVGGFELAGLAGVVIASAACSIPVVADGYISSAAALAAVRMAPATKDWLFASHLSAEPGHQIVLEAIGIRPVLELDMRLGEGTGAALAMGIIDAACKVMSGMATFQEAGVSDREVAQ